jgi:hypothetical protein
VQEFVKILLGLDAPPKTDHEADAIACALAHIHCAGEQVKLLYPLTKAQDEKNSKHESSPSIAISTKENVWRLTHEDWKPEEIAKALNLAVREVELILEIPH